MAERKQNKYNPICCTSSMIDCSESVGLIIFVLNIVPGSWGTLVSSMLDRNGCNFMALVVWFLQDMLSFILIGYLWAILHGYAVWKNNCN